MKEAWDEIRRLVVVQALHKRKGWRLNEVLPLEHLKNAAAELIELTVEYGAHEDSENELNELADVFGCLIGFAVKMGFMQDQIQEALLARLKNRFKG